MGRQWEEERFWLHRVPRWRSLWCGMWRPQGTTRALAPQKLDCGSSLIFADSWRDAGGEALFNIERQNWKQWGWRRCVDQFLGNSVKSATLSNLQYIGSWITSPPRYQFKGFFAPSAKRSRAEPRDAEDEARNKIVLNGNSLIICCRLWESSLWAIWTWLPPKSL